MKSKVLILVGVIFLFSGYFSLPVVGQEINSDNSPFIETSGANLVTKVAPGELLPVSLKLLNFGSKSRVDVLVAYEIWNSSEERIYQSSETIAVETTSSYIKTIQIPFESQPGKYVVRTSVVYKDQVFEARTEFPFIVEKRIFGLFVTDFFLYGGVTTLIAIVTLFIGRILFKRFRTRRFVPVDYSGVAKEDRMFYELLSDTIMGMRERVGDDAIIIAENIEGLKIDKKSGRVLSINDKPSKIIAKLVTEYEKLIGQKVSFSLRRT